MSPSLSYLPVLLSSATALAGGVVLVMEYFKHKAFAKLQEKVRWAERTKIYGPGITLIAGFVIVVASILQAVVQQKEKTEQEALTAKWNQERTRYEAEVTRLLAAQQELSQKLVLKSEELIGAYQKLNSKNEEMYQYISGGDSFIHYDFTNQLKGALRILHNGKYPVYDLRVEMYSWPNLTKLLSGSMRNYPVGLKKVWPHLQLPENNNRADFLYVIDARNRSWIQTLQFRKVDGVWRFASRLKDRMTKRFIWKRVDDQYPRTKDGNIEWISEPFTALNEALSEE